MLFLIKFNDYGYDQYDAFVVRAKNQEDAVAWLMNTYGPNANDSTDVKWKAGYTIEKIAVKGPTESILSSFNAG